MWTWHQGDGSLSRHEQVFPGYSGAGRGKNSPTMQAAVGVGPIPQGDWTMTHMGDSPNTGPLTITLEPKPGTNTFGRSEFRIHGDSIKHPGQASHGCIVLPRYVRIFVWESGDHDLKVIA